MLSANKEQSDQILISSLMELGQVKWYLAQTEYYWSKALSMSHTIETEPNPEVSSVRDSDRILGILSSKTKRAEEGKDPVKEHLLITRFDPKRAGLVEMLNIEDITEILGIPLLGVIPESNAVLLASNAGTPVTLDETTNASQAYGDAIDRFLGKEVQMRFVTEEKNGLFKRLFRLKGKSKQGAPA